MTETESPLYEELPFDELPFEEEDPEEEEEDPYWDMM